MACVSREEVRRLCGLAEAEGYLRLGPQEVGYPVGYTALLADPDEHTLEITFGQEIALTVADAQ